jgi:hypothetical protein
MGLHKHRTPVLFVEECLRSEGFDSKGADPANGILAGI